MTSLKVATAALRMTQAAARSACGARDRADEVILELGGVVTYAGALLAQWDPVVSCHRALATSNYDGNIVDALCSSEYTSDPKWAVMHERRTPLRWADVPGQSENSSFFESFLKPRGFYEGLTVPLYDGSVYQGMLALNIESKTPLNVDTVSLIETCTPSLSKLIADSRLQDVTISGNGDILGGTAEGSPAGLVDSAVNLIAHGAAPIRFMTIESSVSYMVSILPSDSLENAYTVTWKREPVPYDLTSREFDIISGLVAGKSNREIARIFEISDRTVSTHVERILRKFDVLSRTAVVASAISKGIYTPIF
jgi:DNA-binding CsgD family transcriptional regulator